MSAEPHRDPDVLRSMYHDQGKSLRETAAELPVGVSRVRELMEEHGIERRGPGPRRSPVLPLDRKRLRFSVALHTADNYEAAKREAREGPCDSCGAEVETEAHHVVPIKYGGVSDPELMAGLCPSCHKSADTALDEALGGLVPTLEELGE